MSLNIAIAKGKYQQKDHLLEIEAEVNGFHGMFIPFYIFVPIFYIIFISSALIGDTGNQMWFIFPFILFHAAFMLGIPYLIMRRSVSRTKYDLERDFFYMTKK